MATLPGVTLLFRSTDIAGAPTKGRALDHIGFQGEGSGENFSKNLEAAGVKFNALLKRIAQMGGCRSLHV
jgi:hypothetical protein